ncbi:hypothetical protein PUW81_006320 [Microbacterium sp. NM3R9]|uniref:hypothetical protein n=1 Tax=Microbacterium thalli TaxID=3027921 RepID=UPI0023664434|nr:hypothetical protein [Microbacterium thalli]MDN8548717.1 hypothetical protein [Microbacterium thalli]
MTLAPDSAPPALRRVRPPEAPFEGELVENGGEVRYRVAAADAPLAVWEAQPGGHLLAAVDLDRVDGSTVLVLPRLVGRVRTGDDADAPTPGQAVTLAVSVLRGARAAHAAGWDTGEWWLADDGRPVVVPVGTTAATEASIRVLEGIPAGALGSGIMQRAVDALRDGDATELAAAEDALFASAIPEPLGERLVRAALDDRTRASAVTPERRTPTGEAVRPLIERLVDADLAERIAGAWAAVRGALGPSRVRSVAGAGASARRRMMVVAGVVATATLTLGLLWPQSDATEAATAPSASAPTASASGSPTADDVTDSAQAFPGTGGASSPPASAPPDGTAPPTEPSPPGEAAPPSEAAGEGMSATATVEALAACWRDSDPACRMELLERPDAVVPEGIATAEARRDVVPLDDLGGVEVVRVDDPTGERRSQIVVLVVRDDKRLVRDVYDVADQP